MKIRYGFVTNSSSSSFILAFDSRKEIHNLNLSERVMQTLTDSDNEAELEDILSEYREYLEGIMWYDLDDALQRAYGIKFFDVEDWKKEHPTEYQEIYDKCYAEHCEKKVKELEESLKGKKYLFVIEEGDEYSSYFEYEAMKQLVAMMDYH